MAMVEPTLQNVHESLERELREVEGWLYPGEARALYGYAKKFGANKTGFTVVEIGSWKGRSTIALGLGLKARGGGIIYAIDPHSPAYAEALRERGVTEYRAEDIYQAFLNNIERAGITDIVRPLRMTSGAARQHIPDKKVDLLFVDGSHEYGGVVEDITNYTTALADDAMVAFNDPSDGGVYRALRDHVLTAPSPFRDPRLIENTLFLQFHRNEPWTKRDALSLVRLRCVLAIRSQLSRVRPYMPMWIVRAGHRISRWMVNPAG